MQQQQKQPFSIQHIAAHSICRSKYLNKFFWLPTKHYLNFLLLLLFLFFLKITLMHICYFSKIKLEQPFSTCCASSSCCSCCFDLSRVRNFFKKTCYLSFSRHFAAHEKMKKVWRRKNCTQSTSSMQLVTLTRNPFLLELFLQIGLGCCWFLSSVFLFGKKLQFCLINCFYRSLQIELGSFCRLL